MLLFDCFLYQIARLKVNANDLRCFGNDCRKLEKVETSLILSDKFKF